MGTGVEQGARLACASCPDGRLWGTASGQEGSPILSIAGWLASLSPSSPSHSPDGVTHQLFLFPKRSRDWHRQPINPVPRWLILLFADQEPCFSYLSSPGPHVGPDLTVGTRSTPDSGYWSQASPKTSSPARHRSPPLDAPLLTQKRSQGTAPGC